VEDQRLRSALAYILLTIDLRVVTASDAATLQAQLRAELPRLLLFEAQLPGLDASAFCLALRLQKRTRDLAVIVLGAGPQEEEKRRLLQAGADEYIAAGFTPENLLRPVRAFLDAGPAQTAGRQNNLSFADLRLDAATYRVQRNGQTIHLALTEFRLLQHLMQCPSRVHSRDELQIALWPANAQIGPRTIDVHIGRLRCALRQGGGVNLIRTVRSVGYSLTD
jgi:two-component system phosphate regulon response regulator PhoB